MKYISIFLLFLTASCSTNYYQPVADKGVAYVSFANLSLEIPEILIITNCMQSQIDPEFIKYRKPSERTHSSLQIPSNQPVSFVYNYAWFEGEKIQLVTKSDEYVHYIERRTSKDVNTCTEKVTFTPEPNRKYEVYFGKDIHACMIDVSEAFFEPANQKKHLMEVKAVAAPEC